MALRTHPNLRLTKSPSGVNGQAVNSEGVKGKGVWGKAARWVDYSGKVDDKKSTQILPWLVIPDTQSSSIWCIHRCTPTKRV